MQKLKNFQVHVLHVHSFYKFSMMYTIIDSKYFEGLVISSTNCNYGNVILCVHKCVFSVLDEE